MMELKQRLFLSTGKILYAIKADRQGAEVPNKCYVSIIQSGKHEGIILSCMPFLNA